MRIMLRSIEVIFVNEFRLLWRDRASLFMLFVAPVVIIAVAGFSLGNLFGTPSDNSSFLLAVVDQDHGKVANAIIGALSHQRKCEVIKVADVDAARRIVLTDARAPLALVIRANTSATFESGKTARIEIMIDPVKRLQAAELELRLNELSINLASSAQARLRDQSARAMAELHAHLEEAGSESRALEAAVHDYSRQLGQARKTAQEALRAKVQRQLERIRAESEASIAEAMTLTRQRLDQAVAERRRALVPIVAYLERLSRTEAEFDTWFAHLRAIAGSEAKRIPPPPQFPQPPSREQLAQLTPPVAISIARPQLPNIKIPGFKLPIPDPPAFPRFTVDWPGLSKSAITFPGTIAWREASITSNRTEAGAFEQYVPGFGVTFLLIDMLWGMSVALMDEREWGTLQRLRISGASTAGMLIGRMSARTLIGFVQMVVLFGMGWLLFRITLGRNPGMLLLPAAAIAFAAAAFGLVLATIAPSRDSVLPIGAVAAMLMSAAGGCWWPLEFEPSWMRTAALTLPTTWTMRAFNDLMIRGLEPGVALWPTAMALTLGMILLLAGIVGSPRLYR